MTKASEGSLYFLLRFCLRKTIVRDLPPNLHWAREYNIDLKIGQPYKMQRTQQFNIGCGVSECNRIIDCHNYYNIDVFYFQLSAFEKYFPKIDGKYARENLRKEGVLCKLTAV